MPPIPKKRCIACGGTGRNSKGGACVPCKGIPFKKTVKKGTK